MNSDRWPAAAVVLGLMACLGACGPSTPSATPPSSVLAPATASPVASAPSGTPAAPSETSTAGVPYDESLLAILPPTIANLPIVSTPEIAAEIGADPQLRAISEGFAAGVVNDPTTAELAVVMLIRLREGVFADEFFRDYRDSFDEAACAQAGGLVGNAEAEIGGHQTYIASCENGARTYHVHLEDPDLLVSITAAGDQLRLGEQVVDALQG